MLLKIPINRLVTLSMTVDKQAAPLPSENKDKHDSNKTHMTCEHSMGIVLLPVTQVLKPSCTGASEFIVRDSTNM